ncbi:hypothetical protein KCV01_g22611, partial [Aureobasidium melanogenum]
PELSGVVMHKDRVADGLRGIAALCVVLCHFFISIYPAGFSLTHPQGTGPAPGRTSLVTTVLEFPWLSVFWNGTFAVAVFFVLSGYVLTKPFVDRGDLASMKIRAARRYPRLCIPIFGSIMISYVVMALGLSHAHELSNMTGSPWLLNFWSFEPSATLAVKEATYGAIFQGVSSYNPILWTMKVEFIGSMIVFGFRALNLRGRLGVLNVAVIIFALTQFFPDEWIFYAGFIAGSYLGQLKAPQPRWAIVVAVAAAVFFGGYNYSPMYGFLSLLPMTENGVKNFMTTLGAIALIYAVRAGCFQRILMSRVALYLGKVSYAIYLVHFPIVLSFTAWLFVRLHGAAGLGYDAATMITLVCTMAFVIGSAAAFEATFDRFGIKVSKWLFPSSGDEFNRGVVDTAPR